MVRGGVERGGGAEGGGGRTRGRGGGLVWSEREGGKRSEELRGVGWKEGEVSRGVV